MNAMKLLTYVIGIIIGILLLPYIAPIVIGIVGALIHVLAFIFVPCIILWFVVFIYKIGKKLLETL